MARIKGKWVGQVVVDMESEINTGSTGKINRRILEQGKAAWADTVLSVLRDEMEGRLDDKGRTKVSVTVTQLHADLYRDEPSEWTKEEATP